MDQSHTSEVQSTDIVTCPESPEYKAAKLTRRNAKASLTRSGRILQHRIANQRSVDEIQETFANVEKVYNQPRPRPLLGWLWQVSLAGLVNFRLAFGNYRNGPSLSFLRPAPKSPSPSRFM
jgi:membrane carboxypeptidase/penicillin-binding protein PbpC